MGKRNDDSLYSLPEAKDCSPFTKAELSALIREAHSLREADKRLEEVKKRIADIIREEGLVSEEGVFGARVGNLCCIVSEMPGRKTFNRELAIEAGIMPAQIEASMKQGAPSVRCELPEIGSGDQS